MASVKKASGTKFYDALNILAWSFFIQGDWK